MAVAIHWGLAVLIVFGFVVSAVYQTHHFDKRLDDLREFTKSEIRRLEDLIKSEVKRVEERIGRVEDRLECLEHPIYRP